MRFYSILMFIALFFSSIQSILGEETINSATPYVIRTPKKWECIIDTNQLPAKVKMVCIADGKWRFTPTINLACEENQLSLDEYLQKAKEYHELTPETKCCFLGSIATQVGEAKLLQIDRITTWGPIRFIQAALVIDQMAYVITGTCLESDFGVLSRPFFQTIQSFGPPVMNHTLK